jgi:Zn-finger nucleic acid-binding protein
MTKRSSFGDVEIDICSQHGIWLDKGELARIIESFTEQERQSRPPNADDRQHGRWEGMFLGWFSLFLPKQPASSIGLVTHEEMKE